MPLPEHANSLTTQLDRLRTAETCRQADSRLAPSLLATAGATTTTTTRRRRTATALDGPLAAAARPGPAVVEQQLSLGREGLREGSRVGMVARAARERSNQDGTM